VRELLCQNLFIPHFQKSDVTRITKKEISDFYTALNGKGLPIKIINNTMLELKGFFNWLLNEELISRIPPFPKLQEVPPRKNDWYTKEQHRQLFEFCEEPIYQFLRWSGSRPNESRGLLKTDTDWDKKQVSIAHALPMVGFKIKNTKTNSIRIIDFFEELETCLKQRLESSPEGCGFLFTKHNRPYSRKMLFNGWDKMTEQAYIKYGLPRLPLYQGTKHSRAMQMLKEGRSVSDVQEALGHADIRSTDHYAEMLPGRRAELLGNKSQRVTQFSHAVTNSESLEKLAGGRGVEPRFAESESGVLPLNDPPILFIAKR